MIPASSAIAIGSPFLDEPRVAIDRVSGNMEIRPRAIATRDVASLSDISTMRARPSFGSMWVRSDMCLLFQRNG